MRLGGDGGPWLELRIVGYQFADTRRIRGVFDHDVNWLVVAGRASDGERAWSFRDACLLTTDVRRLVGWLEAIADGRPDEEAIEFMEPNLEFRRVSPPGAQPVIRVIFRFESRPPWATGATDNDWDGTWLDLDTSREALVTAARDLRLDLQRFPER